MQLQQFTSLKPNPRGNLTSIATSFRSLCCQLAGLIRAIALCTAVTRKFTTNAGLMALKYLGNLGLAEPSFHKGVNLIRFGLDDMIVIHRQLRMASQQALNVKHSQPPNHQLIKVALRA